MKKSILFLVGLFNYRLLVVISMMIVCLISEASIRVQYGNLYYDINGTTATVLRPYSNDREYDIPEKILYNGNFYTVVGIDGFAFKSRELIRVYIPKTVRKIGTSAFYGCTKLISVHIKNGLESKLEEIGDAAFMKCIALSEITIPAQIKKLGENVFTDSYIQTIAYLSIIPPENWVAASKTIVPNKEYYRTPSDSISDDFEIIDFISFENHEFTYTGQKVSTKWKDNTRYSTNSSWKVTASMPELEKNAGNYCANITFNYEFRFNKILNFEVVIPYHYTIKPAELKVMAESVSRLYGDDNPVFNLKYDGFIGSENIDVLDVVPEVQTNATTKTDVGLYTLIPSNGIAKNYNFNYIAGTLTIVKSPLSLRVCDVRREYGIDNPQFQIEFVGLKNQEKSPKWDNIPIFSTEATISSIVGRYSVSVNCQPHNYEIVSNEAGTLQIDPSHLTLTVKNISREYYEPNPQFIFTLKGLRNNDTNECLLKQPVLDCAATLTSDCGTYKINPSGALSQNYTISYESGDLTITQAPLIISATNVSREYGDPNPILKYEAIGLKGQDNLLTSLIDEPSLTSAATESSNVGEYAISISGASSKNYEISYRQGILTVVKAPLTVVAEDAERIYGENNPIFTRSYNGFKLNDTENSAFSVLPRLTCSASKNSDIGEYPISVEGGTSRNYQISEYHNGILSITRAPLVLTATNKSRLYYETNPQFDFTLSGLKNSDTKSCLTIQPTYSCIAELGSNTGVYSIVPSNAFANNYSIEYNNGTLTVNQRQLTASVGNYSRKYDTENPSFEVNYTGFVNNEDASALTNKATVSCNATRTSDVGTYTLIPMGGNATNYVISQYSNGTLTIEKADQILSWNQDLSNIELYSQIALNAFSDAGLPVQYEMSPNNVATLYYNAGVWYLDCYGVGAVSIRAVQNGNNNYNAASIIAKTLVVRGIRDDPYNPQIYLNVETAGSLPSMIAENRKYQIRNLRLTGNLNGTDISYLREMAGCDSNGNSTTGILETLDISGCRIVSGGRSYYQTYKTFNDNVSDYMFYNCKQLVNLMLPENTTIIEDFAFADCDRLSVISIPDGVKSFGIQSFRNDISLLRIPIPNGMISINDYAFIGCNGISEITIPASVTNIGDGIVKDCQNISKINVAEGNNHFASEDGVLYTSNFDELLIFPVNYESNSYVVKDGTIRIAPYAFVNSKKISKVILPSTLTNIGEDAFIGCVNLSSLQVKALTPPVCYNDCFEAVSKTRCELIVPIGCYSYYWVAPVWSDFNKIKESDFSGIDDILYNDIKVGVEKRNIVITGVPKSIQVYIFKVDGTLTYQIKSTGDAMYYSPSQSGVYIVVIANQTYKLKVY